MQTVTIIGSTGSLGRKAVDICLEKGIEVISLAAKSNYELLCNQAIELGVKRVCIYDDKYYQPTKDLLKNTNIEVLSGEDGLIAVSEDESDMLFNVVVGMVGLKPTLAAIKRSKTIALGNKETLVAGGELVMNALKEHKTEIIPVDSEHSAIFQCLRGNNRKELNKIILTASGGPFFGKTIDELKNVRVEDALNHPNWSMGSKITIDSATMMNKGFEVIEAAWLFDVKPDEIEVVVHRESIIHSLVEFSDRSILAELGVPDMRIPIQLALTYPNRDICSVKAFSFTDYPALTFYKPDRKTFRSLDICANAFEKGGLYPAVVNAANEEAVDLFLKGKCKFLQITDLIEEATSKLNMNIEYNLDNIYSISDEARRLVKELI